MIRKIVALIIFSSIVFLGMRFFLMFWIPNMTLEDDYGDQISLRDLNGKEFGVIAYFSKTPCGGHVSAASSNIRAYDILDESLRYQPFLIYGDSTEFEAAEFTRNFDVPVILDVGKEFAKRLKIRYYAVILYNQKGRVLFRKNGVSLIDNSNVIAWLDTYTK